MNLGGPAHGPPANPFVDRAMHTPAHPTTTGLDSGDPPPNPFSPIGCGHQNMAQVQWSAVNAVQQYGRPVSFEISRKKNETLRIFTGGAESLEMWHDRMVGHISRNNPLWRTILLWLGTAMRPVKKAACLTFDCLIVNSWKKYRSCLRTSSFFVLGIPCTRTGSACADANRPMALSFGAS